MSVACTIKHEIGNVREMDALCSKLVFLLLLVTITSLVKTQQLITEPVHYEYCKLVHVACNWVLNEADTLKSSSILIY
jgi:hypothetical protein